jgi:hypothetical protein
MCKGACHRWLTGRAGVMHVGVISLLFVSGGCALAVGAERGVPWRGNVCVFAGAFLSRDSAQDEEGDSCIAGCNAGMWCVECCLTSKEFPCWFC